MKLKVFITFSISNIHLNITNIKDQTVFKQSCKSNKNSINLIVFYKNLLQTFTIFLSKTRVNKLVIIISGFHKKRFFFLKDFFSLLQKITVHRIFFISSKPFNGCRKKKKRRLLFIF